MAEAFLRSGVSHEYSLLVGDPDYSTDPKLQKLKAEKIADVLFKKSFKDNIALYMTNHSIETNHRVYDLTGTRLFSIMSPAYDTTLPSRNQRDMIYISGQSGSGKSTWAGQYARSYQSSNKNSKIIIFSAVDSDKAFEGVKLKRVVFDQLIDDEGHIAEDMISLEDLKDSLTIFDDIDVIPGRTLRRYIQDLRDQCLQHGRHNNINMICTTHQLMNYKETKILLMEATKVVFFPTSGGAAQIKRFLKSYGELDSREISDIFKIKSRWVMLNKAAPRYILHANGCYMI